MNDRDAIARELDSIERSLRELEIGYEQYFNGAEKREPLKAREALAKKLRQHANRRIMQTDLRFKLQNLATRFHSYSGHWDRILRRMEEGRHIGQAFRPEPVAGNDTDAVFRDLLEAHRNCESSGPSPSREQVATFLNRQKEIIREKFGDRKVSFKVVVQDGKAKIKARIR